MVGRLQGLVAVVTGGASGIGAATVRRFVAEGARMGFVFGKIGIVPDACASWFLPRIVGLPKALEWTYSGELVDAPRQADPGVDGADLPVAKSQGLAHIGGKIRIPRSPYHVLEEHHYAEAETNRGEQVM